MKNYIKILTYFFDNYECKGNKNCILFIGIVIIFVFYLIENIRALKVYLESNRLISIFRIIEYITRELINGNCPEHSPIQQGKTHHKDPQAPLKRQNIRCKAGTCSPIKTFIDPSFIDISYFINEASILSACSHPRIVSFFRSSLSKDRIFSIEMEMLEGGTLEKGISGDY